MRLVVIESPYGTRPDGTRCTWAEIERNTAYARAALLDCLQRGEAPLASHLLYTQVLDDATPGQRETGIAAGLWWSAKADATVVYQDRGITVGMNRAIKKALADGREVVLRRLGPEWSI